MSGDSGGESGRGPGDAQPILDEAFLRSLSRLQFAVQRLRAVEGDGVARRDRRGGRVEFAEHRAYSPGDDPRHVDWAAYARSGRFFVKQYEREDELSVLLVVDASASMALHGKHATAVRTAYALAFLALSAGGRARVALASASALQVSAEVSGAARLRTLGTFLLAREPAGGTDLDASLRNAPRAARGSRIVVVLSDLVGENDGRQTLGGMARRGDDVHVLHLVASGDRDLPENRPVVLVDSETGERVSVASDAAGLAGAAAAQTENEWRAFAARTGVGYLPIDAAAPVEESVLRWLRSGGVVS